uniref:Uncharacterized protein n=1 Tax=Hyaloperonospora arabidopsidis (strain Emoy2) TaxID=559515 RepID=M4BS37_HYAAE
MDQVPIAEPITESHGTFEVGTYDSTDHVDGCIELTVLARLYPLGLLALCAGQAVGTLSISEFDTRGRVAGHLDDRIIT